MSTAELNYQYEKFSSELARFGTHGLTLQTKLYTCNSSGSGMDRKVDNAKQAFREFRPKLNRLLTGNGWVRSAQKLPLVLVSLEGSKDNYDRNKSLHFHLTLGNFDVERLDVDFLEKLVKHWCDTGIGTDDIKLTSLYDASGFGGYCSKEVWKSNNECIDLMLSQIPAHLTGI